MSGAPCSFGDAMEARFFVALSGETVLPSEFSDSSLLLSSLMVELWLNSAAGVKIGRSVVGGYYGPGRRTHAAECTCGGGGTHDCPSRKEKNIRSSRTTLCSQMGPTPFA